MTTHQQLYNELVQLLNHQLGTLEDEVFGVVSEADRYEYECRQDRIRALYGDLLREQ